MAWQESEQIRQSLEAAFNAILQTRMHDVSVLNPALSVHASGFLRYQQDWLVQKNQYVCESRHLDAQSGFPTIA